MKPDILSFINTVSTKFCEKTLKRKEVNASNKPRKSTSYFGYPLFLQCDDVFNYYVLQK